MIQSYEKWIGTYLHVVGQERCDSTGHMIIVLSPFLKKTLPDIWKCKRKYQILYSIGLRIKIYMLIIDR